MSVTLTKLTNSYEDTLGAPPSLDSGLAII